MKNWAVKYVSSDLSVFRIYFVVLTFDFFARCEEFVEEKNPGAYAPRLALAGFFRLFRVFRGSISSLGPVAGESRAVYFVVVLFLLNC